MITNSAYGYSRPNNFGFGNATAGNGFPSAGLGVLPQAANANGFRLAAPYGGNVQNLGVLPQGKANVSGNNDLLAQLLKSLGGGGIKSSVAVKDADAKSGSPKGSLSGSGSITGNRFRSPDGESYTIKDLVAGKAYNLLSDGDLALNGVFKAGSGTNSFNLSQVGLTIGGDRITFADDGTFRINGQPFSARKNNLGGAVTKSGNAYVVKSGGYELKFSTSGSGVSVGIKATAASSPDGLWGSTFDNTKQKASEIESEILARDYRVDNLFTDTGTKAGSDTDLNTLLWNGRNPKIAGEATLGLNIGNTDGLFNVWANGRFASNAINYSMKNLQTGTYYNLFSDEGLQVTGSFKPVNGYKSQQLDELAIITENNKFTFRMGVGKIEIYDDGKPVTGATGDLTFEGPNNTATVTVKASNGETYKVYIGGAGGELSMEMRAFNLGSNSTRSTGLLGDALGQAGDVDGANISDVDGAGYIRDEEGKLSRVGQNMQDALAQYVMSDITDLTGGYGVSGIKSW